MAMRVIRTACFLAFWLISAGAYDFPVSCQVLAYIPGTYLVRKFLVRLTSQLARCKESMEEACWLGILMVNWYGRG